MKNTIENSDDENIAENTIQYIDNECVDECSQASVKQNFIREEKLSLIHIYMCIRDSIVSCAVT